MRFSDLQDKLQNLTKDEVSMYQIAKILNTTTSKIKYRKDNNAKFSNEEVSKLVRYFNGNSTNLADEEDSLMLEYYPEVFGSCGGGAFELSQQKELIAVPKKCFFTNILPIKKYSVINARGNSMQPAFYENDKLIVEHWNGEQIIDNKPYVFCYKDEIFVKRLAKNVNQLIITSDNRDYDIIKLTGSELNDVNVVGQIVGLMRDLR